MLTDKKEPKVLYKLDKLAEPRTDGCSGVAARLGTRALRTAVSRNETDWEVLPKLTSDNLREMGIGHRRKLLAAIAELETDLTVAEPVAGTLARLQARLR